MIVTELYKGQGLGNQLWCYVVTRVIATDNGYSFGIQSPENFKGSSFLSVDFGSPVIGGSGPEGGPPKELPEGITHYYNERRINHPETGVDIRTYDKNLVGVPDNTKIDGIMQDENYITHRKEDIRKWLQPTISRTDYAKEHICIINFRGGEYVGIKNVFLTQSYWDAAILHMRTIREDMEFVVVTDDPKTAQSFFPSFKIVHDSIGDDYSIINNAHYLILSNSSFAWFPAWLNTTVKKVIAPKYWSQHNVSDGYWGCGYNITKGWFYLDRDGILHDYESCKKELEQYAHEHASYFEQPKIRDTFLVVSNYHNDLSWVPEYSDTYLIYDQSASRVYPPRIDAEKIIKAEHLGHNIRDYCTYIIDHYDNLPDRILFCSGNVFPRHVSIQYFNSLLERTTLTPFVDPKRHKPRWPIAYLENGLYWERNDSWYLAHHPTKYFRGFDDFMQALFEDYTHLPYIPFAPGATHLVPKECILLYSKQFYENLRRFVSHTETAIPGESHIIERALYVIWSSTYTERKELKPVEQKNRSIDKVIRKLNRFRESIRVIPHYFTKHPARSRVIDVVTYNGEKDLLDIRLHILNPFVDEFVIVEAPTTFSGNKKPLYYEKDRDLFKRFTQKIRYHVIDENYDDDILTLAEKSTSVPKEGASHWHREFCQKESIKKAITHLRDSDVVYIGDVDEVWQPLQTISGIKKLKLRVYSYYLNLYSSEIFWGPIVARYESIKGKCLNDIRTKKHRKTRDYHGWHFTSQGGIDEVRRKLNDSYTNESYNTDDVQEKLQERFGQKDYIGRSFTFTVDESNLPHYLKKEKERYKHLFK